MVHIEEIKLLVSSDYNYGLDSVLRVLNESDIEEEGTKIIDYDSREVATIKEKHNKYTILDMSNKEDEYLAKG